MDNTVIAVYNKLDKAKKYFNNTSYSASVVLADSFCRINSFSEATKILNTLPGETELLNTLVEKLKGKSVYKTLKQIESGAIVEGPQFIKGLFSLGTHVAIEVHNGNKEYSMLYSVIYEKLGEVLYNN